MYGSDDSLIIRDKYHCQVGSKHLCQFCLLVGIMVITLECWIYTPQGSNSGSATIRLETLGKFVSLWKVDVIKG